MVTELDSRHQFYHTPYSCHHSCHQPASRPPFPPKVVRLRLARFGRKHAPTYRIVAADARCPRDGKHIEQVGSYDPKPRKDGTKEIRLKADRIKCVVG